MLDEFQIPYEQDFDKMREKIMDLKLQADSGANNVDKQFILKILSNQLDSQKIESLKNRQLRVPTNRYDVEVLKQWLDFMVFKIYQDDCNSGQEILEKAQTIFESCFQEILKQVSIDCSDRGDLLSKVWKNQNELFSKLIEEQQRQRLSYEQECLDEITRVHKMYSKEIQRLKTHLMTTEDEKNKLSERFDLLKNNVKYLKKNNKYVNKMLKGMKEDLDFYKKKNSDLEYATNQIKKEYLNLSNSQQQITPSRSKIKSNAHLSGGGTKSNIKQQSIAELKRNEINNKNKLSVPSNYTLSHIKQIANEESDSDDQESQDNSYKDIDQSRKGDSPTKGSINVIQQLNSEENLKTVNAILEQQSQLTLLQDRYTKNQINMQEITDDEDSDFDRSMVLLDKSIDAQDWQNHFCIVQEVQTDGRMEDLIFKNEINQCDMITQVDQNVFKEFGDQVSDKEVQTTDLDPEYEEKMKGQDIQGLEKFLDNIQSAQELYDKAMDSVNVPFEVKKAMHNYLKFLHKNQEQMQFLLKTEIGMKEKYHKENMNLKIFKKENQMVTEELQQKVQSLKEANKIMEQENEKLDKNIFNLVRRTRKLTQNMDKFQRISSQLYTESSKFAGNIKKSSLLDSFISQVAQGEEVSQQDILNLRSKFQGENDSENQSPGSFGQRLLSSQVNIQQNNNNNNNGEGNTASNKNIRDIPIQTTGVIQKIQKVVQQLVNLNIHSMQDEDMTSSDTDNDDDNNTRNKPTSNKINRPSDLQSLTNFNPMTTSISQKSATQFDKINKNALLPYKFNNPKFERRKVVKINTVNTAASSLLFNRIVKKMQQGQPKKVMTRKYLCKIISQIYQERIKNEHTSSELFHVTCYDYFISSFCLKQVAEKRIMAMYESIYYFKSKSPRVKLFGQFLNLFDDLPMDELEFYLHSLKVLDEDTPAFVQTITQTTEVVYCSFEKLIGLLKRQEEGTNKIFIEKQIGFAQKNRILSKQNSNYPMIDVDIAMERVLEGYRRIKQNNKELDTLFNAADLDLDGVIGFYEFMCLYKYIEKDEEKESLKQGERLFFSKCDALNSETGEKSLSLEAFSSMCTLNNIFKQAKVEIFMSHYIPPNHCQNYQQLSANYTDIFQQIKMRLYKAGTFTSYFSKAIHNLSKQIKKLPTEIEAQHSIWISYRILDLESKKAILVFEIQDCMPSQFIDIMIKYKENGPDADDDDEQFWPNELQSSQFYLQ